MLTFSSDLHLYGARRTSRRTTSSCFNINTHIHAHISIAQERKQPPLAEDESATQNKHLLIIGAPDATFIRSNLVGEIAFVRTSQKLILESGPAAAACGEQCLPRACPGGHELASRGQRVRRAIHDVTMSWGKGTWRSCFLSHWRGRGESLYVYGRVRGLKGRCRA